MTQHVVIRATVVASIFTLAACRESTPNTVEDPGPSTSGHVLRLDSLGAHSVATHQSEPVTVVGQDAEKPEYLFHRIRDGILTDDGFWIADGGSNEIRRYSSDGIFQYALGGPGDGPGEFRSLARIFLLEPDSLLAFDAGGRVTVFGRNRQVIRTFTVPWLEDGLHATEYVRFGSRRFAALVKTPADPRDRPGDTRRDTVELVLMDLDGKGYRRTGVRLPDKWWTYGRTTRSFTATSPPNGPSALLATLGTNLVTSTSERPELEMWVADAFDPALPSGVAGDFEQEQRGDLAPRVIDQLLGTDDGGLWIGLHPTGEDAMRRWIWIDSESQIAGRVDFPKSAWLLDARGNQLLVRAAGSLGNQSVQVLAIR